MLFKKSSGQKVRLAGLGIIDAAFSNTSTNGVQNKVIKDELFYKSGEVVTLGGYFAGKGTSSGGAVCYVPVRKNLRDVTSATATFTGMWAFTSNGIVYGNASIENVNILAEGLYVEVKFGTTIANNYPVIVQIAGLEITFS